MSADLNNSDDVKPRRVHLVYLALAFFDVLAVCSGLYLSHRLGNLYAESVAENQVWAQRRESITVLAELASETNAPGNDIFDSHDVALESTRVATSRAQFDAATQTFAAEIQQIADPTMAALLQADLALIVKSMDDMQSEANYIFSFFEKKQPEEAGKRMATMDRRYALLVRSMALMSRHVSEIQQQLFMRQMATAQSMRKLEWAVAFAILAMVVLAIHYGYRVARMMQLDADRQNHSIRHLRELTAQLQHSELVNRNIINSSLDAIIGMDAQGRVQQWNPQAEQTFGWSREETLGENLGLLIVPPQFREAHQRGFQRFLDSRRSTLLNQRIEISGQRRNGEIFPLELSITPLYSGETINFSAFLRDISARKKVEQELQQAHAEVEKSNLALAVALEQEKALAEHAVETSRIKSEFLANMSHEIRTPMNGVIGMTGLLLDTDLNNEQRRFAETIRASGESLLAIINDILDFSKIESGHLELEPLEFELRAFLDDFASIMAVKADEKKLALSCLIKPDVPAWIKADPGRLRQILINLAGNAIKFTKQGEVKIIVGLESRSDDDCILRFSVRDTGIGIPANKIHDLFERFTQVDASTTRKYGGTGLGLAICKQLSQLMGGEIAVRSEFGRGSEFTFTIHTPLLQTPEHDLERYADLRGCRVLVVDDSATNCEILETHLRARGIDVTTADNGGYALYLLHQALETKAFDFVLLDMHMPQMDGVVMATMIKWDERLAKTHLLLLTSIANMQDVSKLEEIGFIGVLPKPVRINDVLTLMSSAIKGNKSDSNITLSAAINTPPVFNGVRVLLTEDNVTNQMVASTMLKKMGCHVDVAANGKEALQALSDLPYDLVLMDMQMPEMDGLSATAAIRQQQFPVKDPAVTIIAMTANAMQSDKEQCLAIGMNDYLTKPLTAKALQAMMQKWLVKTASPS